MRPIALSIPFAMLAALALPACSNSHEAQLEQRIDQLESEKQIREAIIEYGEYLDARVHPDGAPSYRGHGWYAFGSWVLTGESRGYSGGNVGDVKPKGPYGAVELALRYSELDLDDAPVAGGTESNWTFGANWYINRYLKLQGNYVHARSDRRGLAVDPNIVEVRAQIAF